MAEVRIDIELISSFINKASDKKADLATKNLLKEWASLVKGYIINSTNNSHYVVVEDEEKFNDLIERIKKVVEG